MRSSCNMASITARGMEYGMDGNYSPKMQCQGTCWHAAYMGCTTCWHAAYMGCTTCWHAAYTCWHAAYMACCTTQGAQRALWGVIKRLYGV